MHTQFDVISMLFAEFKTILTWVQFSSIANHWQNCNMIKHPRLGPDKSIGNDIATVSLPIKMKYENRETEMASLKLR